MAVPDFQSLLLPVLKALGDGKAHHWREVADHVAKELGLSDSDLDEKLKSGGYRYYNRIQWTKAHFMRAGVVESPARAQMRITKRGMDLLKKADGSLRMKDLMKFPEYAAFRATARPGEKEADIHDELAAEAQTSPEERIDEAFQAYRSTVVATLLDRIRNRRDDPKFFERLVADLMAKLGYGESQVTKLSGDEGIDGVVKEDLLGFDVIYLQAKNWENPVGRPEIQKFLGSLVGRHAKKGVFVTTSTFTKEAVDFVQRLEQKIVLIDGTRLGELLYDHDLAVQQKTVYEIKEIDENYFDES